MVLFAMVMTMTTPFHSRLRVVLLLLVGVALAPAGPASAGAQDTALRAERTITFSTRKAIPLAAKVGPVNVQSVEFQDRGRITGSGGLMGIMRSGIPSEVSTNLRVRFLAENPSADEWAVTFTVEFLDKEGKLIDRITRRSTWEGESKPYEFDHPLLEYVVAAIAQVRVKLDAKLD
jgi:hypothetical protein